MSASEVFLLIVRWVHLIAAAAWVGGSLFYLLVLRPALRRSPEASRVVNPATASEFRALVDTSIFLLLATGVVLTLDRLTSNVVEVPYAMVLSVKIAMSVWMFLMVRGRRRMAANLRPYKEARHTSSTGLRRVASAVAGYNAVVILGIAVFLLSDLLKVLFEIALED